MAVGAALAGAFGDDGEDAADPEAGAPEADAPEAEAPNDDLPEAEPLEADLLEAEPPASEAGGVNCHGGAAEPAPNSSDAFIAKASPASCRNARATRGSPDRPSAA